MKSCLETCKQSKETKLSVETFIDAFELFSADYEVRVLTLKTYQSVSIFCDDYLVPLSCLCDKFRDEFGSDLHVAVSDGKLEFWFLNYLPDND